MRVLIAAYLLCVSLVGPASACEHPAGKKPAIPTPGASIESALKRSKIAEVDVSRVRALQVQISALLSNDEVRARELEERAMNILGYEKAWLKCGQGTFGWSAKRG
ncbi:MAG: hypothetical protein ACJ72H_23950 [Candidatus Sulfotelmatobacter sp.]